MFRRTGIAVLLIALVALMATVTRPGADELPAESFAKMLPADTFVFAEFNNVPDSIARARDLAIVKMWKDPEIADFFDAIMKIAQDEEDEEQNPLDKANEYMELTQAAFSGKVAIAVTKVDTEAKEFKVVMAATLNAESKPKAQALVDKIIADIMEEADEKPVIDDFDFGGHSGKSFRKEGSPDKQAVYCVLSDKFFVLTMGRAAMEDFINNANIPPASSLYNHDRFVKAYKAVQCREMFWYADYSEYMKLLDPMVDMVAAQMPWYRNMMDMTSKMMTVMAGGLTFDGERTLDDMVVFLGEQKLKYLEAMKGKRNSFKSAKIMPKNALAYMSIVTDMSAIYEDVFAMLGPAIADSIAEFENSTQMTLKDEILPAFGEEFAGYFNFVNMSPEFMMAVELRKPEVVDRLLDAVATMVPVPLEKKAFQEHTIRLIQQPGMGMEIGIAITAEWLLIGDLQSIQAALNRGEDNFSNNEEFVKGMREVANKPVSTAAYIDLKSIMGIAYDYGMMFGQAMLAQYPEFDPALIPSREAFTARMMPWVITAWVEEETSGAHISGPIPYSVYTMISMMAATFMFTLVPADDMAEPVDEPEDVF